MTMAQLVRKIDQAGGRGLVNAVAKKSRMMDRWEVFYVAELYLPDKTVHAEAPTPDGIWKQYQAELGEPPKLQLGRIDLHRLARRERA